MTYLDEILQRMRGPCYEGHKFSFLRITFWMAKSVYYCERYGKVIHA